ncbi:hypothetical protein [Streptomyces sp. RG80]|uniref:hypothetical protein n=1 Tax=Streptomyces sp. RG80 TaxID=3157340 RepID=UPI00338DD7C7
MRVLLIGGTSHTGKSTLARAVGERLGWECLSTDGLARHPGRPWGTVPEHVVRHYGTLSVDELIRSVLDHFARLWPRIQELITERAEGAGPRLVLEGSALWPDRVAGLDVPHTEAVWLTVDDEVLGARMRESEPPAEQRPLVDKFLARSVRYQRLMVESVDAHGLCRIDTADRGVAELVDAVLARPCRQGP